MITKIMQKTHSGLVAWADRVGKTSLQVLVFLLPLFFLPWTGDKLDFNKQALLLVLVLIALCAWMVRTLVVGNITVHANKINIFGGLLLVVSVASTIFSVTPYGSFWGWPQSAHESLLTLLCLLGVYFLVSNLFSQKDIFLSFIALSCSVFLVQVYGILQILGLHLVPLSFAKTASFTTIGSLGALGFFTAATLPLSMILLSITRNRWRLLFAGNLFLALTVLVLINYRFIWILALLAGCFVLVFWILKRNIFDARWSFVPIFFIIVSLFFALMMPHIRWLPEKPLEVSISQRSNLEIDMRATRSSPLVGSGPGTFAYDFAKFRSQGFNAGSLWNIGFESGASVALTLLATIGIMGLLLLLAFWGTGIFYGARFVIFEKQERDLIKNSLIIAALSMLMVITVGYFLRNTTLSIHFLGFFAVASLIPLLSKNGVTYVLKPASFITLATTFAFTLVAIFGLGLLMLEGQRYIAEVHFARGMAALGQGNKEQALQELKVAVSNNARMYVYFTQIANVSVTSLQDNVYEIGSNPSEAEKALLRTLVSDAIAAANVATKLGPNHVETWSTKGYVCQSLHGLLDDAVSCAIDAYTKAIVLNPFNPYLFVQQGNVYLVQAANLSQDQATQRSGILDQAEAKYEKALELKPDYALAHFQMGLLARAKGNTKEEITHFGQALAYAPNDASLAFQIGYIYYQEKNWNLAQKEFQRALALVPTYANVLYYSGLAYDWQGNKQGAMSQFIKLMDSNPTNETVKKILENLRAGRAALDGLTPKMPVPEPLPSGADVGTGQ